MRIPKENQALFQKQNQNRSQNEEWSFGDRGESKLFATVSETTINHWHFITDYNINTKSFETKDDCLPAEANSGQKDHFESRLELYNHFLRNAGYLK